MATVKRIKHIDLVKVVRDSADTAILAVAEQGVAMSALLAPVDTGGLKQSITANLTGKKTAVFGSNFEYAPYQEFGTSKMSAQPYLRPAADKLRSVGSRIYAKVLKGVLRRG